MLEGRLQKRLRAYHMSSFKDYYDLVASPKGKEEVIHMVDRISTNKTDFFREPAHFDFLTKTVLPKYQQHCSGFKPLNIWSSACSSGEEVYTIGLVIEEFNQHNPLNYTLQGTDISYEILKKAVNGVYPRQSIEKIPISLREKYFLKSKDRSRGVVRVVPKIRHKTSFSRLNLMGSSYGVRDSYDIIFCRNVLIYFDRKTQEEVIKKQCHTLKKGGYFFMGHTESINGMAVPLTQVRPTIYQKI